MERECAAYLHVRRWHGHTAGDLGHRFCFGCHRLSADRYDQLYVRRQRLVALPHAVTVSRLAAIFVDLSGAVDRIRSAWLLVVDRAVLGGAADLFLRRAASDAESRADAGQHQLCVGVELHGGPDVDAAHRLACRSACRVTAFCLRACTFLNDALHAESLLTHAAEQRP